MFDQYYITDKDLNFFRGDYFIGFFGIMATSLPNFLYLIGNILLTFTDLYVLKNYLADEVKIGGYGLG
jgi:hypothetical protein